jgi:ubiquinone/menaquinone biosynthesis C-methylase UbiE
MRDLEDVSWWNAGMREVAASLLDSLPLPDRGSLVDIGCGSGQTMLWFERRYPGWTTMGLDVAAEGLVAGRQRGARRLMRASALALPIGGGSADLVMSMDVLQHLPLDGGDERALAEMARILKPGGALFIRTNAQAFPHTPDDAEYQFHKYTVPELEGKLRAAGFRVKRISRINALLGLAEIPREMRARGGTSSYHGLLARPRARPRKTEGLKRRWLTLEGAAVRRGVRLPIGRTIVALCTR